MSNRITQKKFAKAPKLGVEVFRGPTLDGLGKYVKNVVTESAAEPVDVARILRETRTDVVVSYLPVGSENATRWYAERILEAGCGFINCIPVFIASRATWRKRFEQRGLPIIGDDIKSQVGATIVHRVLTDLFEKRGVRLDRTYQLNFGGNTDFMNMLERERLESKKISKTQAVTSQLDRALDEKNVHVGPSDYVPWLSDRKWCYIRMEGHHVRRCAAELRIKAGGMGFAQFRRRRHRCHPLREAGAEPWREWRAQCGLQLLHEITARPVHR